MCLRFGFIMFVCLKRILSRLEKQIQKLVQMGVSFFIWNFGEFNCYFEGATGERKNKCGILGEILLTYIKNPSLTKALLFIDLILLSALLLEIMFLVISEELRIELYWHYPILLAAYLPKI